MCFASEYSWNASVFSFTILELVRPTYSVIRKEVTAEGIILSGAVSKISTLDEDGAVDILRITGTGSHAERAVSNERLLYQHRSVRIHGDLRPNSKRGLCLHQVKAELQKGYVPKNQIDLHYLQQRY